MCSFNESKMCLHLNYIVYFLRWFPNHVVDIVTKMLQLAGSVVLAITYIKSKCMCWTNIYFMHGCVSCICMQYTPYKENHKASSKRLYVIVNVKHNHGNYEHLQHFSVSRKYVIFHFLTYIRSLSFCCSIKLYIKSKDIFL